MPIPRIAPSHFRAGISPRILIGSDLEPDQTAAVFAENSLYGFRWKRKAFRSLDEISDLAPFADLLGVVRAEENLAGRDFQQGCLDGVQAAEEPARVKIKSLE